MTDKAKKPEKAFINIFATMRQLSDNCY